MHWLSWLLLSNVSIAFVENTYRSGRYSSFLESLPILIVPILCGQLGLFYGFRNAPSLFTAGIAFSLCNVAFRIANSYYLGESLNLWGWIGVGLLIGSAVCFRIK